MEIESTLKQENSHGIYYTFECSGQKFTVDKKYELKKLLGHTSDGAVCLVIDKTSNQLFSLKKIVNVFQNLSDARKIVREICLARSLNHENVLKIVDIMQSKTDVNLVTEYLETDLHRVRSSPQPLSNAHIQFLMYQLIRGIFSLHSTGLIIRTLYPPFILVSCECDLKISYLRSVKHPKEANSEYFPNRRYLPPEILLGHQETQVMDIWAAGCILGEFLGRRILFPGYDDKSQLETIFVMTGTPQEEDDLGIKLSEEAQQTLQKLKKVNKRPWTEIFPGADPVTLDLLDNMLNVNLQKRFTAFECLRHPYFQEIHDLDDEPICKKTFSWDSFDSQESLQRILDEQIKKIHSEKE